MKRTEAIYQLAGYLSTYEYFSNKHPEEILDLAKYVLDGVEKIGMLPPETLVKAQEYYDPNYRDNVWDLEDE